jgi:phage-related baseplate assembly protein
MARFIDIDLSSLPAPDAVQVPDFEALLALRKADIVARFSARVDDPVLIADLQAVLGLESEPLTIDAEAGAYRETIVRERINDAVRAVLLATSQGADLDNLVARLGVQRLTAPGDPAAVPPVPDYRESDNDLRRRYILALEAFSTAGPYGAYLFHALTAHPHVKDAGVYGPEEEFVDPGHARIVVLSRTGTGVPSQQVLDAVLAQLSPKDVRPLTDYVDVVPASVTEYEIVYHLEIPRGPDPALVVAAAEEELAAYAAQRHRVGAIVADSGLDAAAHRPGVERAIRSEPAEEVDPGKQGAAWCTGITVTWEVVGD